MINILSPAQKRDIHAARINVVLVRYCVTVVLLVLLCGLIYGLGFWILAPEKAATLEKIAAQSDQSRPYAAVEKEADSFRNNLTIAKSILSKETSYSTFLTTLAAGLPSGTVLTQLSIGHVNTSGPQSTMVIEARTSNYNKTLELKNSLEQTELFENVSIINTSRPEDITRLPGLEARYPYTATYSVKLSTAVSKPESP